MSTCPSPETLDRLGGDSLDDSGFASLEAHVRACPHCQGVLEHLAADASVGQVSARDRLADEANAPTIPGFVLEHELGRGGTGVVYQAWQPLLDRRVAIKILFDRRELGVEQRKRWLREARAMARVQHPNIVALHDVGEHDGFLYLVLELIAGGSLAKRLAGPLPPRIAVELIVTATRAVEHLHQSNIFHLDIKPSNILLDGVVDDRWDHVVPMITDFGIARTVHDPGASDTGLIGVSGTPSYMAPEQIGDRSAVGPQADVFALGATLYTLLTGRPPFQAVSVIETLDLVRTSEPALLRTLIPGVPRDLETIALTCLRKDPERRYASALALRNDLERWRDGFPIQARPVSRFEHARRWCRRRPALASVLATLALTVALSLLGLLALWRQADNQRMRAENALSLALKNEKAASEGVRELVDLLATTVNTPQMLTAERVEITLRVVRDLTVRMRNEPGIGDSNVIAICNLVMELSADRRRRGKHDESRALLMDSLELIESQSGRSGADPRIDETHGIVVISLAVDAREREQCDEAIVYVRHAEEIAKRMACDQRRVGLISQINAARQVIAMALGRHGPTDQRRHLLEDNVRMFEQLDNQTAHDPTIQLFAALSRLELTADDDAMVMLRTAVQRFPASERLPEAIELRLAEWIANDITPYTTAATTARLDPDADASRNIKALESRCEALGLYPKLLPPAASRIATIASYVGAAQRAAGQLEDARRTAASQFAFASKLVQTNPGEPWSHLILGEAFSQQAKNAWKLNDLPVIEAALRNAFGEACFALSLDPNNESARVMVSFLQEKIVDLLSPQRPSR